MTEATDLTIPARDRRPLAATVYQARGARFVAILAGATGMRRQYYTAFAHWLAGQGITVVTFDYRGTGGSLNGPVIQEPATMRDWGTRDLAGVIDWVTGRFPGLAIVTIGHSVGGQMIGLAPNANRLAAVVGIGAQSGYWGHWPRPLRYRRWLDWHVVVPALARLFGHVPAGVFGMALPPAVARQWARWCRRPDFIGEADAFARFGRPYRFYAFTDDDFAPLAAVRALHTDFAFADRELRIVDPVDWRVGAIGHFGFFRTGFPITAWAEVADWLEARVTDASRMAASA